MIVATYTVEIKRGDRVINTIVGKEFSDQIEAWRFVEELSYHYYALGMRVLIKDQNGSVFLMAGFTEAQNVQQKLAS
jgi:hypothetical protein